MKTLQLANPLFVMPVSHSSVHAFRKGFCYLVLFLCIAAASTVKAQLTDYSNQQLDQLITDALSPVIEQGPGVAVFLHVPGREPYQKIVGQANLEYGIPLTEHSVFDLASVAKQFTGLAIAKLEIAGELSLDDDIRKYLPEVPDFGTPITLAHLLYHTSGLRDVGELSRVGNFSGALTGTLTLDIISRQKALNFAPGTAHDYSNTGYVLLALIVERVTKQSFAAWCEANIFSPLQMMETCVNDAPDHLIKNRAVAYYGRDDHYSFNQNNGMSLIGSSAVFSSLRDMKKWMTFLAGDDPAARQMRQPGQLKDGSPVNYNYGLNLDQLAGQLLISHSGSTPAGFRTVSAFLPEQGIRMVVLSNWGELEPIQDIGKPILELLLDLGSRQEPASEVASKEEFTGNIPLTLLDSYAGQYLFNGERAVSIRRNEQQLVVSIAGMSDAVLEPRSDQEFYLAQMHSILTFEMVEEAVSQVIIQNNGQQVGVLKPIMDGPTSSFIIPTEANGYFYSSELDLVLSISQQEDGLWLSSGRHGTHRLLQRSDQAFTSETDLFESLSLETDAANKVVSLTLNLGSRARNLHFARWQSFSH